MAGDAPQRLRSRRPASRSTRGARSVREDVEDRGRTPSGLRWPLARAIAERAGRRTACARSWADASARSARTSRRARYGASPAVGGGAGAPETVTTAPDWRGLLDLLEAHSATSFDDLWRTWVARDTDLALLDARATARVRYDEVVAAAGNWLLPRAVRDALRAWQLDQATEPSTTGPGRSSTSAPRSRSAADGGRADRRRPRCGRRSRAPDGFAGGDDSRRPPSSRRSPRYDAAAAARPDRGRPAR